MLVGLMSEVTSLDRSPGPALYTATRLTPLDEVRGVLRARIASGSPVHGARLAHDAGVDVAELLGLDHPELRGALIQLGRWWMVRPGLDEAKRRALLW